MVACLNKDGRLPSNTVNITATADSTNQTLEALPTLIFEDSLHDFGKITEGEEVTFGFKFTNMGNADLLIAGASASCGCTVADYPKNIIKPNETGVIKVKFNSKDKPGFFDKTITVLANTIPVETFLTIKGEVLNRNN